MNQTNPKRKTLLIISIIILITAIFYFVLKYFNKSNKTLDSTFLNIPIYNNLELGISTEEEIIQTLGYPVEEISKNGIKVLEYSSKSPNYNNELSVENGKLAFVKEIITLDDNIKISDIVNKYGDYENILYGPNSNVGFYLYVYLTKGIAYIGHQESGLILEIWYFPPTDFDTFKESYASDYGTTIPMVQ